MSSPSSGSSGRLRVGMRGLALSGADTCSSAEVSNTPSPTSPVAIAPSAESTNAATCAASSASEPVHSPRSLLLARTRVIMSTRIPSTSPPSSCSASSTTDTDTSSSFSSPPSAAEETTVESLSSSSSSSSRSSSFSASLSLSSSPSPAGSITIGSLRQSGNMDEQGGTGSVAAAKLGHDEVGDDDDEVTADAQKLSSALLSLRRRSGSSETSLSPALSSSCTRATCAQDAVVASFTSSAVSTSTSEYTTRSSFVACEPHEHKVSQPHGGPQLQVEESQVATRTCPVAVAPHTPLACESGPTVSATADRCSSWASTSTSTCSSLSSAGDSSSTSASSSSSASVSVNIPSSKSFHSHPAGRSELATSPVSSPPTSSALSSTTSATTSSASTSSPSSSAFSSSSYASSSSSSSSSRSTSNATAQESARAQSVLACLTHARHATRRLGDLCSRVLAPCQRLGSSAALNALLLTALQSAHDLARHLERLYSSLSQQLRDSLQALPDNQMHLLPIGSIVSSLVDEFETPLKEYAEQANLCRNHLQELYANSKVFRTFDASIRTDPEYGGLGVVRLLWRPVHILHDFASVLQQLSTTALRTDYDHQLLCKAHAKVIMTLNDVVCEDDADEVEADPAVVNLLEEISELPSGFELNTPGRRLLKRGRMHKLTSGSQQEREFILFSDILMWCRASKMGRKPLQYKGHSPLEFLIVKSSTALTPAGGTANTYKHAFQIVRVGKKKRHSLLIFKSARERQDWFDTLQRVCIAADEQHTISVSTHGLQLSRSPPQQRGGALSPSANAIRRQHSAGAFSSSSSSMASHRQTPNSPTHSLAFSTSPRSPRAGEFRSPVRCTPHTDPLTSLPEHLLGQILSYLDPCSLIRLSGVCHALYYACRQPSLWREIFQRDFQSSLKGAPIVTKHLELDYEGYVKYCLRQRIRRSGIDLENDPRFLSFFNSISRKSGSFRNPSNPHWKAAASRSEVRKLDRPMFIRLYGSDSQRVLLLRRFHECQSRHSQTQRSQKKSSKHRYLASLPVDSEYVKFALLLSGVDDDDDTYEQLEPSSTVVHLVCFDISQPDTFDGLQDWKVFKRLHPEHPLQGSEVDMIVLCGLQPQYRRSKACVLQLYQAGKAPVSFDNAVMKALLVGAGSYVECNLGNSESFIDVIRECVYMATGDPSTFS
mmetsp:Transcript_715/g.2224  ORF Transcript_715/g.2224 Transcript_715/m.2224 type:complete len:1172 (-) Transcript_715:46-3561(-)